MGLEKVMEKYSQDHKLHLVWHLVVAEGLQFSCGRELSGDWTVVGQ